MTTPVKKPSPAVQKQIDAAVQAAVASATAAATTGLVQAVSKPQHINDLRKVWRQSAEHKAAQVKRFIYAMVGVIVAQMTPEIIAGKNPLDHFTDAKTAWYFLLPFALVAWRQLHPSMTASQVDSAPGVTIVPEQVTDTPPPPPPPPTGGDNAVDDTSNPSLSAAGSITGLGGVPVADDAVGAGPVEGDAAP